MTVKLFISDDFKLYYWWLIELPFWFKAGFWLKILGILTTQYVKDT